MDNSLITMKNYGKIVFHFKEIMDDREITRNKLATMIGTRFEVADRFYNGNIERLDIDLLARICAVLKCSVSDVLEYIE